MTNFNLWTWNSRIFPGIDSLNVRLNDKVRIRIGNLTMTNHPMHLHGHEFLVTGTDGGPTPKSTRLYEVTTDVAVGQMRQIEFLADEEGDWAFHCHKSHHTMNAMGHDIPTMIGVDHRGVAKKINNLIPDYMVMGERGMADMTEMEMPIPDNTIPMMTGEGPFGSVEMGGMFSVVKVRRDQKPGDYKNPGWYKNPRARWRTNTPARWRSQPASKPKVANPCPAKRSPARTLSSRSKSRLRTAATDRLLSSSTTQGNYETHSFPDRRLRPGGPVLQQLCGRYPQRRSRPWKRGVSHRRTRQSLQSQSHNQRGHG